MDARRRRAALLPSTVVVCDRLRATLSAASCATRAGARYPSGRCRGAPRFHPCGACDVGAAVLAALRRGGWERPADSVPAQVLEPEQRLARLAWARTFPAHVSLEVEREDVVREASRMTPDDHGTAYVGA